MNRKIKSLLHDKGENYILPFLWQHGEEEPVLREYMKVIHDCGIGAVCVESRPHPDYCGPRWWHDMDIILEEAKRFDMKVWILDDSHFPTGYANGAMKDAPAELCRQYLYYSLVQAVGPMKGAQLSITGHAKYRKNPFSGSSIFSGGREDQRVFDDDRVLSVCAVRIDQGFDITSVIDLTDSIKEGELVWDVPAGRWGIYVNYLTRNAGSRSHYINMLDNRSVRKLIDAVYEPHFEHYKEEFGKTIAGFFSDEPELGNGEMYSKDSSIGTDQDLPWSSEVEGEMGKRLGNNWRTKLPLLWTVGNQPDETAMVRYTYMDIVTRLVEKDFSKQLGGWCEEHGVEYIGHLIEDNNAHARLGSSLGHFFRGLSGQHMSGIDDIGGQVMPAGEVYPLSGLLSSRDGEFYHYVLGKLGSSYAAIDPMKKGRTMCEIFGAYGWSEGVRLMKYLVDHFLVRGVNRYVPHAFSPKAYPDPDCPPHFYAQGHNPQYRHFGALMRYLNRMCALISNGRRITPAAILYHAEAEWTGEYMLMQKPAHVLMDHQIDFDFIPTDVFEEKDRYGTVLGRQLQINGNCYRVLIVPYTQYITERFAKSVIEMKKQGFPVLFIKELPSGICDGDNQLLTGLADCQTVSLDQLVSWFIEQRVVDITVAPEHSMLRYLHYREDNDIYFFTNEDMFHTYRGTVTVPVIGAVYAYNVWDNRLQSVQAEIHSEGTTIHMELPPYQSLVIVFDNAEEERLKDNLQPEKEVLINNGWTISLAKSKEYPNFHDKQNIITFKNIGLKYPDFSGFIRYENTVELPKVHKASLVITDAFEGVEVFINDDSAGIQVVPPYDFDISKLLKAGKNSIRIEVANTLERERYYATPTSEDFFTRFSKPPVLSPSGIVGEVKLFYQ